MGGNESVQVTAGIWGFLVLFGLAIACFFLFRSMNTHLRRVTFAQREEEMRAARERGAGVTSPGATSNGDVADVRSTTVDDDPIGSARH